MMLPMGFQEVRGERRMRSTMESRWGTHDHRPKTVLSRRESLNGSVLGGEEEETGTCSPIDSWEPRVIAD